MRQPRWNDDKRYKKYGWRLGSRRWWVLFAGGMVAVIVMKTFALSPEAEGPERLERATKQQLESVDTTIVAERSRPNGTRLPTADKPGEEAYERLSVKVYLTSDKRMERLPIELYVRGVLAAEMPVEFELEALKAQAIAARTYIYRRLYFGEKSGLPSNAADADVTDTVKHQVYFSLNNLLSRWEGEQKKVNLNKLNQAVEETKGQIITYDREPIQAAFFSTSNGYTEKASDYWEQDLPYLQSVASPWDKELSPRYKETVKMKLVDAAGRLGVKESDIRGMRVLETTEGKRVKEIAAGKKIFSGREVRERLELASSQFSWTIDNEYISVTTYGFGHGVGMSQWGANGMAKEGRTALQIISHYYTGAQVEQASKLPIPGSS